MKNDPEFNIRLVKLVEEKEDLYNFSSKYYCDRNVQDRLWREIGEVLGEDGMTLRERWNNLRGNFSRSLKHTYCIPGERNKREYYLSKHMQFLIPYMKTRKSRRTLETDFYSGYISDVLPNESEENHGNISITDVSPEILNTFSPDSFHEASSCSSLHNTPISNYEAPAIKEETIVGEKRKLEIDPLQDSGVKYFQKRTTSKSEEENCDLLFLRSLLPQMAKLSEEKKLEFKIEVLQQLKRKLYE